MLSPCCCFTGHRRISAETAAALSGQLDALLRQLFAEGVREFYCGGALGFDTLAEEAVLRLREREPSVRLHLILPCPDQDVRWPPSVRRRYAELLEQADDVEYAAESYSTACIFERNRRLVDYTTICAAYRTHAGGGTDYTAALTKAKQLLDGRQDKTRPGYVVFISDGAPGYNGDSLNDPNWNGSNQVAQLKAADITIYTIGIALDGNNNQAAREYLKGMASSPSHFRNITDANLNTQLETILTEWAAQINEVHAGTNAVMVDVINDEYFDFVSADDGLTYDGDAKSLTWDIGDILKAEQSITFKIKPKDGWTGTKDTNKSCTLTYTKHDGTDGEMTVDSPHVTITAVVGSITVNKTVVMPEGDTTSVKDREYTFTIQSGGHTDSKKVVIGDNNTGSVTFDNVPVGEYTVTEAGADIDGYNVVTTSNPADGKVKVAEGQAATIAFTNTYTKIEGPKGELTISKVVNGLPTEILPASFVFEIRKV